MTQRAKILFALLATSVLAALATAQANAQASGWFGTAGGDIRLVIAPPQQGDTQLRGIIDVRLAPGWKTYWRDPGASGIPPRLSIDGSSGLTDPRIHFPAPVWIDNPYGDFAGYDAPVALPFTVSRTADGVAQLNASVFLGICEDICIPVEAEFDLRVAYANGTTLASARVQAAHAALPGAPVDGLAVTVSEATQGGQAIIAVAHDAGASPQLFVHAPDGTQFKPPRIVASSDGETRFALEPARPAGTDRAVEANLTVRSGALSYEAAHSIPVAAKAR